MDLDEEQVVQGLLALNRGGCGVLYEENIALNNHRRGIFPAGEQRRPIPMMEERATLVMERRVAIEAAREAVRTRAMRKEGAAAVTM